MAQARDTYVYVIPNEFFICPNPRSLPLPPLCGPSLAHSSLISITLVRTPLSWVSPYFVFAFTILSVVLNEHTQYPSTGQSVKRHHTSLVLCFVYFKQKAKRGWVSPSPMFHSSDVLESVTGLCFSHEWMHRMKDILTVTSKPPFHMRSILPYLRGCLNLGTSTAKVPYLPTARSNLLYTPYATAETEFIFLVREIFVSTLKLQSLCAQLDTKLMQY